MLRHYETMHGKSWKVIGIFAVLKRLSSEEKESTSLPDLGSRCVVVTTFEITNSNAKLGGSIPHVVMKLVRANMMNDAIK